MTGDAGTNGRGASSMSLEFALRPSSIEGIKRLADRMQRDEAIQRAEALERASRSAGYSNYAHARRSLADSLVPERPRHDIHITAYWHDLPTGETGRETLVIVVDHPRRTHRSQAFFQQSTPAVLPPQGERPRRGQTGLRRSAYSSQGRLRRSPRAALHRRNRSATVLAVIGVSDRALAVGPTSGFRPCEHMARPSLRRAGDHR